MNNKKELKPVLLEDERPIAFNKRTNEYFIWKGGRRLIKDNKGNYRRFITEEDEMLPFGFQLIN